MTRREVRQAMLSYRDIEGVWLHALKGEGISVHPDYLAEFDRLNDPDRPPPKQKGPATTWRSALSKAFRMPSPIRLVSGSRVTYTSAMDAMTHLRAVRRPALYPRRMRSAAGRRTDHVTFCGPRPSWRPPFWVRRVPSWPPSWGCPRIR